LTIVVVVVGPGGAVVGAGAAEVHAASDRASRGAMHFTRGEAREEPV